MYVEKVQNGEPNGEMLIRATLDQETARQKDTLSDRILAFDLGPNPAENATKSDQKAT